MPTSAADHKTRGVHVACDQTRNFWAIQHVKLIAAAGVLAYLASCCSRFTFPYSIRSSKQGREVLRVFYSSDVILLPAFLQLQFRF